MQAIRDRIKKDQKRLIEKELNELWSSLYQIYQNCWTKEDFEKFRDYLIETMKTMRIWTTLISQIDIEKCVDLTWAIDKLFEKRVDDLLSRIDRFDSIEREFSDTETKRRQAEWSLEWLQYKVSNLESEKKYLKERLEEYEKPFWKRLLSSKY